MTCGSIYKIQFPNGKHYIGLTTASLARRTIEHKCCAKNDKTQILYKALRKYGMVDTFELIEIDTADTLEELCEKEIEYIIKYNSQYMNGNGYNMTFGGEGTNGYVYTEDDRQKMSERMKKYFENPEARKAQSERLKKHYEDHPEERQKMSEIKKQHFEDHPEIQTKRLDSMGKNKKFDVFKTDGTFIKTFTYQFEAREYLQKEHNITSTIKISEVLAGNRKSSAGFVFKYK